ncbi:MAG TPA: tRNA uridine-5-carboxymethylaminomethyl(34) synthesis enzyme MnmG, partial [Calditrichaeota bacterium]|nr:tRNA uridine-5-carboxymethylaminomethyl(34) synthesis enzyme MnmG [Calditrichota bacterium]
ERSYIRVRTLNTTKGLAVQAWRAQIDKKIYKMEMRKVLENTNNLTLKQGEVVKIITKNNKATGILTATGIQYNSNAIVLTTGTYMRSFIVIGPKRFAGGPHNQPPSFKLGHSLEKLGFKLRRLQTATPVRVDKKSLDFSKFKPLYGETPHPTLSFFLRLPEKEQLPSYLTFTNNKTIEIINKYIHTSPLVIGNIIDTGPRHCPSIERKVIRFPEK